MPDTTCFPEVFERLKAILVPFAVDTVVMVDEPTHFSLDAPPSPAFPNGVFFAAVRTGKRYVSYHLMPVYAFPDLLTGVSDSLKKRMQGKSCFNFTSPDEAAFAELAALTRAGAERARGVRSAEA